MDYFNRFVELFIKISFSFDYLTVAILLFVFSAVTSGFSVNLKTAVYGYPKISYLLIFTYFSASFILYLLAITNLFNGGSYFNSELEPFIYYIITFCAIIGLYALFYRLAEANYTQRDKCFDEITVALSPIAEISEEPCALSLKTEKMGVKRPRFDDSINYLKAEEFFDLLKTKDLSPIEKATLSVCENTVKHYKNTLLNDWARNDLNNAFLTIVKLYAKYFQ